MSRFDIIAKDIVDTYKPFQLFLSLSIIDRLWFCDNTETTPVSAASNQGNDNYCNDITSKSVIVMN